MTQNVLSNKGKEKLLLTLENYIDAKIIENKIKHIEAENCDLERWKATVKEAKEAMKDMIMALEIETTGVK